MGCENCCPKDRLRNSTVSRMLSQRKRREKDREKEREREPKKRENTFRRKQQRVNTIAAFKEAHHPPEYTKGVNFGKSSSTFCI